MQSTRTPSLGTHMTRMLSHAVLLALTAAVLSACGDASTGLATTPVGRPAGTPAGVPVIPSAPPFPALTQPGTVYVADSTLYGASVFHGGWLGSRLVMYDTQHFDLQFSSPRQGFFGYTGSYVRGDSTLTLTFDAASGAGPWVAIAHPEGDALRLTFNAAAVLADFADGLYVATHR